MALKLLRKYDNFADYAENIMNLLNKNMLHMVDQFVDSKLPALRGGIMAWHPHIDLKETPKEYILHVDIPGVKKQDISVKIENGILFIRGERKCEEKHADDTHHWMERFHGKFLRSFRVPEDVVEQKDVDAKIDSGVLTIVLKKKLNVKNKKSGKRVNIK